MVSEQLKIKNSFKGSNTNLANKYQSFNKSRVSQSHSNLIVIGEKPQRILQSDIVNSNGQRQSLKIDDQIHQMQPSGGDSSYVMDMQHPNIPSSRVLISNIQIDSKNKQQNQFQTPVPNHTQKQTISKQVSLNDETSKQVRPQSQQHQIPKQISSKDKNEKKINQSFYQIQMDPIDQFQSRNDQGDHTLTQNHGKILQIMHQNKFQPFEIDANSQMNANTAGAIGMDGMIRINNNKTVSENGDAFTQMQINNITNRKIKSLKSQIQNQQMSAASSIQKVTHHNILDLQKKSYEISNKSIVVGTQDGNLINLFNQQDNYQYLDIYGKNDFQYQANSRLDIGTEPQSSISYQMPLEATKTINKIKEQEDSRMMSQKEEISHEKGEKTRIYSKNQRSFTATSKSIKDKLNEQGFLIEIGMTSNSNLDKKDLFQNGGAQFQNETIQDSVKSVNAQEVQNINKHYQNNVNQNSHKNKDSTLENYQRFILNPLQTNFQALQSQILSDVQVNGISITQKLNQKKEKAQGIEQSAKFKKNRKLVQNEGLKSQKKDRYGSAMMVQHQTTYLQQAQSLARYRNLFDPMLQKNNQKLQFDNLYVVQGNSFKLIQKQKGQTNDSIQRDDSKIVGTTLPNESGSYKNIIKNNHQLNNHITENTFQNIETVNAGEADTDNVTRVHESRYSAFSRIGSNLHNQNNQQDQKFPSNYYLNHLQSSRDLNVYPSNLMRVSSQQNFQKNKHYENYHQPDNEQFHYQIENMIQNELKNEKFNQTTNMNFQSAFQQKEITENNSIAGGKTYNPLNQFQPIKGVQIMLNQNNFSGKTTPVIQMGAERISGSHNSSTRKIFKGSKPISTQQTPRLQDSLPIKERYKEPKKIDDEIDVNLNYYHLQENVVNMKNVKISKDQRKKKNNSQLKTLLSLQNVQQSGKQPSLKNAMWGNDQSSTNQIYDAQSTPFLKKQTTYLGINDTNFNNTGQQNKRTNSTYIKSQQDINSNLYMQRSNYDNIADSSNGLQINDAIQSYRGLNEQEPEFKKKVKKNDQNALNKKWMSKFFRKREQIQSASANQAKKRKKNTSILNNLLQSKEKGNANQALTQKYNDTETSFKKNETNEFNMISFNENQKNDNFQNNTQQNEIPQRVIINNIVSKEIILSAQKEIQVEYKKESQDQNQVKRDLYSAYNLSKQKAIQNYKLIQKINEQQENAQKEEVIQEEQKEIEKIMQIIQKQNIIKKKKDEKDIKQGEKQKQSATDIKSQQMTRKIYQQERENELLNQINMFQNIQQFNNKSQQKILQFDENTLRQAQQKNETLIEKAASNQDVQNKSFQNIKLTSTPQRLNKTSIIHQSSEIIKVSADISVQKSQNLMKSKKSIQPDKKLTIYQKQEIEFQKVYKQKIEELRALPDGLFEQNKKSFNIAKSVERQTELSKKNDATINDQSNDIQINKEYQINFSKDFSLKDYNIYQERNLQQNILSTRMITLGKYLKQSLHNRQFLHKDQVFEIDPIRQKIRVMPQNRVPLQQGISPEYYFIQSTKHCLRNNLPLALQSLHKGFSINPNNLYCRITHGVIMFKLGLFSQAKHDFQIVVSMYPKEPFCHYNYALTLLQMGELNEALKAIDVITNKKSEIQKADFELLQDANVLQAICLWRTNCPLEAVKCLNIAQRFKAKLKEKHVAKQLTSKQLQDILNDYNLKEIQQDILQDKYIYDSVRSQSQKVQTHYSKFLENREFSFNQAQSNLVIKENQGIRVLRRQNQQNKKSKMEDEHIDIILGYEQSIRQQSAGPAEYQKLFRNSFQDVRDNMKIQEGFPINFKKQLSNTTQQLKFKLQQNLSRTQNQSLEDITFQKIGNQQNQILNSNSNNNINIQNNPIKAFPDQIQKQYNDLKTEFVQTHKVANQNQKSKEDKLKEIIFNQKLEQFYNLLRDYQVKIIDEGQKVSIEKIKEEFLKQLYDTNSTEGGRLKDYKNIELINSHVSMQYVDQSAVTEQIHNQSQETRNVNQIVDSKLQNKIIEGTVFTKNGIVEINKDQRQLEMMMFELQNKFKNISEDFFNELDRDDHKIFQKELKEEDITEYKNVAVGKNAQLKQGTSQRDQLMYGNDKILKKLRENLNTENNLPFDLCNILKADIEEKGKQRQIEMQSQKNQQKRIENRKLMMIKHEFQKYKGKSRHVQILDLIIGNLKFFQRFNEDQRKSVYENAEYVTFPARTVIFRQGDLGDKMYVILKGRVAVEKKSKETGNLPLVIAILEDGQHFGELSLIDQEKVANNTKKSHILDNLAFEEQPKFQGRKASCITTEQTDLLILNQDLSVKLYQPTNQQEVSTNSDKFIIQDKESENTEMKNDELSRKIRILQKIPYFNDVDPKNLMPIAANIVPRTYSYGEFLVKRGEVPQGLFIIIKGQCKVVATRFGVRRLLSKQSQSNDIQNQKKNYKKLGIIDGIINQFNPETSILNQVKTNHRAYQNERVLIDEKGKEIKDRIEYQDFMAFSQLTQGNVFGGRILIPFEHYQSIQRICFGMNAMDRYYPIGCNKEEIDSENEEFYHMKSLLSIVADSAKVDVWIIEKQDMNYLQDKDLKLIYEKIVRMKEDDRPYHEQDINFIVDQFQKWDKYKIDCIEALFDRKIMEKWFKGKS